MYKLKLSYREIITESPNLETVIPYDTPRIPTKEDHDILKKAFRFYEQTAHGHEYLAPDFTNPLWEKVEEKEE